MKLRDAISITIFGVCAVLTIRAINIIPHQPISVFMVLGILMGPVAALLFFKKRNWLRSIVGILAFAGLFGLGQIGQAYGRAALYGDALQYPGNLYTLHGVIAVVLIMVFVVWYIVRGRIENDL